MQKPDLSQFPATPGVYLFKDAGGRIIYVGKAIRLRNRLASYFRPESALTPKTRLMVNNAVAIDILHTGTEKEALLLEASLIKKHKPRYNIDLRDDKDYLLFRINDEHPYPRLEVVRKTSNSRRILRGRIFGPFVSGQSARETWRLIHRNFPLRRCKDRSFTNRTRPCLYYDMQQCLGPCCLDVPKETYFGILRKVELLLEGRQGELTERLKKEMIEASDALLFEKAARLRDQLKAVQHTIERQSVVLPANVSLDLIGVSQTPEGMALGIVFVRNGQLIDGRNFFWSGLVVEDTPEVLMSFMAQYYLQGRATPPRRIVLPWLTSDQKTAQDSAFDATTETATSAISASALASEPIFELSLDATPDIAKEVAFDAAFDAAFSSVIEFDTNTALADTPNIDETKSTTKDAAPLDTHSLLHTYSRTIPHGSALPDTTTTRPDIPGQIACVALVNPGDKSDTTNTKTDDAGDDSTDDENANVWQVLEATLSEQAGYIVRITSPRNHNEDQLVAMAVANAKEHARVHTVPVMAELLAGVFRSPEPIHRIEVVDISHTSGRQTRAGMVVFENEQPLKSAYRTYALDDEMAAAGYEAGDDYAALGLWAARRAKAGEPWANLVLVDGGKGQLAAVHRAFTQAGVADKFILASIAKARDEDGHTDRRAGNINDRIFLPQRSNPLPLKPGSAELLFLQRIRDIVHDFSIGRHRKARAAATMSGELTRLPGVGKVLAKTLFTHFGSLAAMAKASEEELQTIPGVGKARASMLAKRLALLVQEQSDRRKVTGTK